MEPVIPFPHAGGSASPFEASEPRLQADAILPDGFAVPAGAGALVPAPRAIFLTGATGFLGAHLLDDLLRETDAEIFCLTRAASPGKGLARIERARHQYELPGELPPGRVHAVCGELEQPHFGLGDADYLRLTQTLDLVVHGAATMNFYQGYEKLRAANVLGTLEVLRFAVRGRVKPLHYISSSGVFDSMSYWGRMVTEADRPLHCDRSVTGYTQTKWVAERLVLAARDRGLPVCVHRPPFIMGHGETGVVALDNLVVKLMAGSLQGGIWPDDPAIMDLAPVDFVSRSVVRLLREPTAYGRVLHLVPADSPSLGGIGRRLAAGAGYRLDFRSYAHWKQELRHFARRDGNALRPLAPFFLKSSRRLGRPVPEAFLQPPRPSFDGAATRAYLRGLGLPVPAMDDALFGRYAAYFVRAGWAPPAPARDRAASGHA